MNNKLRSILKKLGAAAISLIPFGVLFFLWKTGVQDSYLFEWMGRRAFLYIWIIAGAVSFLNKWAGFSVAYSYFVAFWIGNVVGDVLRAQRITMITYSTTEADAAMMYHHYGFFIWLSSFLLLLAICLSVVLIKKHLKKKREKYKDTYYSSLNK